MQFARRPGRTGVGQLKRAIRCQCKLCPVVAGINRLPPILSIALPRCWAQKRRAAPKAALLRPHNLAAAPACLHCTFNHSLTLSQALTHIHTHTCTNTPGVCWRWCCIRYWHTPGLEVPLELCADLDLLVSMSRRFGAGMSSSSSSPRGKGGTPIPSICWSSAVCVCASVCVCVCVYFSVCKYFTVYVHVRV
jgi:hypothetical protein